MRWLWRRPAREPVDPFDLRRVLFRVSKLDEFTLGHVCEGVGIFGATGAGKTSGPGDLIARALLDAGAGFLVLCAKTDECERWERLCRDAGRGADFVRFGPGAPEKLDVLQYALSMPGGTVDSAAQLLDQLADLSSRSSGGGGDEKFWALLAAKVARRCIAIARLGVGVPPLGGVRDVICFLSQRPCPASGR
jgi:hypothetical protein